MHSLVYGQTDEFQFHIFHIVGNFEYFSVFQFHHLQKKDKASQLEQGLAHVDKTNEMNEWMNDWIG